MRRRCPCQDCSDYCRFSRREFRNREAECLAATTGNAPAASVGANSGIVRRLSVALTPTPNISASVGANSGIVRRQESHSNVASPRASVGANSGIVRRTWAQLGVSANQASVGANSGIVRRGVTLITQRAAVIASVGANSGIVRRMWAAAIQANLIELQSARIQES